jgi:hypothetical protein
MYLFVHSLRGMLALSPAGKESGEGIVSATLAPDEIPILFIEMGPLHNLQGEC